MEEDISKKTIFVLLVLTILVSVLSTWTLIESTPDTEVVQSKESKGQGNVRLVIEEPPGPVQTRGNVQLTIMR